MCWSVDTFSKKKGLLFRFWLRLPRYFAITPMYTLRCRLTEVSFMGLSNSCSTREQENDNKLRVHSCSAHELRKRNNAPTKAGGGAGQNLP